MRRGSELYATLGNGELPVTALFSYKNGNQEELFAATENTIYNITTVISPENFELVTDTGDTLVTDTGDTFGILSTTGLDVVTGLSGGDWVVVQFASSGGVFLVAVNGVDPMLIYDGQFWYPVEDTNLHTLGYENGTAAFTIGETVTGGTSGATGTIRNISGDITSGTLIIDNLAGGPFQAAELLTDGMGGSADATGAEMLAIAGLTGIDTREFSYVWSFKNRLFFVQKESLSFWFLTVDAISGVAAEFPLGGVFNQGGALLFGSSWSIESGDGLANRCAFFTTEGEVAVYSGLIPGAGGDFALVGVYRVGKPLGQQAHIRAGGDIVVATDIGFVPLSVAVQRDYAALSPSAISFIIEEEWNKAVLRRSSVQWRCEVWPANQMVAVALPTLNNEDPMWFVANARTGAWAAFTIWDATCMEVFQDRMFFGSTMGRVIEANVTGSDEGEPYTASFVPLFDDLRSPASLKIAKMARAVLRSPIPARAKMSMQSDFDVDLPSPPAATPVLTTGEWGTGIWGTAVWGEEKTPTTVQQWQSVGGSGYALAPGVQLTSGSVVPSDVEIARVDMTYTAADIVS